MAITGLIARSRLWSCRSSRRHSRCDGRAVEGSERHDQHVGVDLGAHRPSARGCPIRPVQRLAERVGPHDQRLAAAGHTPAAPAGPRPPQARISGIGLISVLSGEKPGDDDAGLDRDRKRPRRDRFGRGLRARRRATRRAARRGLAQLGFEIVDRKRWSSAGPKSIPPIGSKKVRSRDGRRSVIPGTYISRWAPYDRTQGPARDSSRSDRKAPGNCSDAPRSPAQRNVVLMRRLGATAVPISYGATSRRCRYIFTRRSMSIRRQMPKGERCDATSALSLRPSATPGPADGVRMFFAKGGSLLRFTVDAFTPTHTASTARASYMR